VVTDSRHTWPILHWPEQVITNLTEVGEFQT